MKTKYVALIVFLLLGLVAESALANPCVVPFIDFWKTGHNPPQFFEQQAVPLNVPERNLAKEAFQQELIQLQAARRVAISA